MKVTRLPDVEPRRRRVAVGTFDGVHLGHREVIRGADTVLTFEPHPAVVLHPDTAPQLLTSLKRKAQIVAELGAEEVIVVPFDTAFAARSAEAFADDVLVGTLGATHVSVGENFRFGHRARGDAALLAAQTAFETSVRRLVELDGEIREERTKVVASRGRLVRRVEAWDDALRDEYTRMCADRGHELARGASPPLEGWEAVIEPSVPEGPALLGFVAARIAEVRDGVAAYHAERARQTDWLVARLGL